MPERDDTRDSLDPPTARHSSGAPRGTVAQTPDQAAKSAEVSAGEFPQIPGYEVCSKLGEGGMGVVYLAKQLGLNRDVAVKTLVGPLVARATLARFWAEAEVMAEIKHPNVVQVIELGEHAGKPFMAMELVRGGSLANRLRGGVRLPPPGAAELMERVARGVAAAHELGIIHRDLKPDNILMDGDTPKVADFGIAKRKAHEVTQTNAMMGTPAYMAPEQASAQSRHVGPAADVWSLGAMLYECLSGKRPFEGDTVFDVLAKIASEEPRPLRTWLGSVPRDLETVVAKCMTKEPELRYATAKELADDLGRFVRGEPIAARPLGTAERVARWVRRKPAAAAAYGLSALAAALALVVFVIAGLWQKAEAERTTAEGARAEADSARVRVEDLLGTETRLRGELEISKRKAEDLAETVAVFDYGRTVQLAHQAWRDNNLGRALALLAGVRPDLRGWEWQYVHRVCNAQTLTLSGHSKSVTSAVWSPDGRKILTASDDGTALVWDAKTGERLVTLEGGRQSIGPEGTALARLKSASWSHTGKRILTTAHGSPDVLVWDSATGESVGGTFRADEADEASLSPDGSLLATGFCLGDGRTVITDLQTKDERDLKETSLDPKSCWSPDGSRIITSNDDAVLVEEAKTGRVLVTLKHDGVRSSQWSPDGSRVCTACRDGALLVWDAKAGTKLATLKGHAGHVRSMSWSRNGSRILTVGEDDKTARVWDAKNGTEVTVLKGYAGGVRSAEWSPDGSRVLTTATDDATARVWDAKTGEAVSPFQVGKRVGAAEWSPDGSRILTTSPNDGTASVWDAGTGEELLVIKDIAAVASPSWSPDGSRILSISGNGAKVWEVKRRPDVLTIWHDLSWSVSPDGTMVAVNDRRYENMVNVWEARIGTKLATLTRRANAWDDPKWSLWSPNGTLLVTRGRAGTISVWHTKTWKEVFTYTATDGGNHVEHASWNPRGGQLATTHSNDTVRLWDVKTWENPLVLKGYTKSWWRPDGSRIATVLDDGTARLWDTATGKEVAILKGKHDLWCRAQWSPDGSRLLTIKARPLQPGSVAGCLSDAKTGAEIATLNDHVGGRGLESWSPDGSRILTTGEKDNTACLWDGKTGTKVATLAGHASELRSEVWSPDGAHVLTTAADDATARVWDAKTGAAVATLKGHAGGVRLAVWSADGSRVLTGDADTARVWDAKSGTVLVTLRGHTGGVESASWSPDGTRILTGSSDETAKVWDAKTGAELLTLLGHAQSVTSVSWSSDGSRILTRDFSFAKVWDSTPLDRQFRPKDVAPPPRKASR